MHDDGAAIKMQEQIFRPTLYCPDYLALQALRQILGDRPAQSGIANHYTGYGLAFTVGRNALASGFYFG
jgi:hypothetical protein